MTTKPLTLDTINNNINTLGQKVGTLEQILSQDRAIINIHPILFIMLLILFFVTMDFWAVVAHKFAQSIHPRGYLTLVEYVLLAIAALVLLIIAGRLSGIDIRMLGGN